MSRAMSGLFIAALALVGCSGVTEKSVVGNYRGEMLPTGEQPNVAAGLQRGLASSLSLEIKPDKTFHLVAMVVPIDGTWTLEGSTVTLTPNKMLGFNKSDIGISAERPTKFQVVGDKLEPVENAEQSRFRFIRQTQ